MFHLARSLGYYDGVAIEIVDYQTPAEAIRAYQNDVIDAVAMTTHFLLQVAGRESGHRAVLVIDESMGGDALVARPGIASLADLRGRAIGVEMSVLGEVVLARALTAANLQPGDVRVVSVDLPDQVAAFAAGQIDAAITYEPFKTQLEALGGRVLFASDAMPGEITDVLFTRERSIRSHRATLQALVDGFFRAVDYLQQHPDDAGSRCAAREGVTRQAFRASLAGTTLVGRDENRDLLAGRHPGLVARLRSSHTLLRRLGHVPGHVAVEDLVDGRLVAP